MTAAVSHRPLQRFLAVAAQLPPARARALLHAVVAAGGKAIQCGARRSGNASLAERHAALREPHIARLHNAIGRVLDAAKRTALKSLEFHAIKAAEGVSADLGFGLHKYPRLLTAAIRTEGRKTLDAAGEQLTEELGQTDPFKVPNPKAIEFFDERDNLLKDTADNIFGGIQDVIVTGMHEGKSRDQIARDIREAFREIEESRAETIATTETGVAYGFARQEGMRHFGVTHKRWVTSHDDRVRDTHRDAEEDARNQAVPVDEPFSVGTTKLMYPGDPASSDPGEVINCRCISVAANPDVS